MSQIYPAGPITEFESSDKCMHVMNIFFLYDLNHFLPYLMSVIFFFAYLILIMLFVLV